MRLQDVPKARHTMVSTPSAIPSYSHTGVAPGQLTLLLKVARCYHDQGMSQASIAQLLHMSQSRVSRLLSEASRLKIVRTTVMAPPNLYPELEDQIREAYGAKDIVVVDAGGDDGPAMWRSLGAVAADYLEATLTGNDLIGLSSWSATLLATVDSMTRSRVQMATGVVQLIGGVGRSDAQVNATRLTDNLALITKATAHYLPTPGLLPNRTIRDGLLQEDSVTELAGYWPKVTLALVGIGSVTPSELLSSSGNSVSDAEAEHLRNLGAVGDVCLRFLDPEGNVADAEIHDRVLGIDIDTYKNIERRLGIAGGKRKFEAIRAALRGGWINILVTDLETAQALAASP